MTDRLTIEVCHIPIGKGRPRVTRHGTYTPTSEDEEALALKLRLKMGNRIPFTGPIGVRIICFLPKPKRPTHPVYPIVKPDLDNLLKHIWDASNGILWDDDKSICHVEGSKQYAAGAGRPGYYIEVWRME